MSEWYEAEEIDIDHADREVSIFVKADNSGRIYLSLSFDQIKQLAASIQEQPKEEAKGPQKEVIGSDCVAHRNKPHDGPHASWCESDILRRRKELADALLNAAWLQPRGDAKAAKAAIEEVLRINNLPTPSPQDAQAQGEAK